MAKRSQRDRGFLELGYATVDTDRASRCGAGEVVFGEGKTAEQIAGICTALLDSGEPRVLVTRVDDEKAAALEAILKVRDADANLDGSELGNEHPLRRYPSARLCVVGAPMPEPSGMGTVAVVSAGTSDEPVAEEAALTAEFLGNEVRRIYDVGVAGIHRLLAHEEELRGCRVVVVVCGMEGALASVVAGLVACPVIAVPTSVGYGSALEGVTALLAMMSSCAAGVSVVGIDNGFGAGYQASQINHL